MLTDMRRPLVLAGVVAALLCAMLRPATAGRELPAADVARLDAAVAEAIDAKQLPGAVIEIGDRSGVIFTNAYGNRAVEPAAVAMTVDTIFDLASLSKSIGCATSVMVLVDQGKLNVTDPITRYLPRMNSNGKDQVTVEQCLLHTAGFVADNPMSDYDGGREVAIAKIDAIGLKSKPGEKFVYSDVGFIVLGEIVQAVSGEPLERFAAKHVFGPLGMTHTAYHPPAEWKPRIAPTEKRKGEWIVGEVHDPRAFALGGAAGHAGVFGTAADVGRWCRMLLNGGELDGKRVLSAEAVKQMTTMRTLPDGTNGRGYGLDFTSGFAPAPRGNRFEPGRTFGHTGWTGTSFWIDPEHGVYVVLLTSRVHPDGKGNASPLRRKVATIAAEALLGPAPATKPG
jgi:CubicO group peptidase (beta-lactamase class C family)